MKYYLTQNEKMKKMAVRTFNFGIPAYRSRSGFNTCPQAGKCALGCYARSGWYVRRPVVIDAYQRRLELTQSPRFVAVLIDEIKSLRVEQLRVHDSGDMYSTRYLKKWLRVITALPDVRFYTYTKMVAMMKAVELPPNFKVVYSYGGRQDRFIDPDRDAHCRVFENEDDLLAAGYQDASVDDSIATSGALKIGIVYHHQKNWENTGWPRVKFSAGRAEKTLLTNRTVPLKSAEASDGREVPRHSGLGIL